jgi:hypothetical protein
MILFFLGCSLRKKRRRRIIKSVVDWPRAESIGLLGWFGLI